MLTVHATGAFAVTQAAWPHMKAQGYGRVVMTSSPAGLFGALGAAPYCAAKLAVVGLMHGIQAEGRRYGICVNAIAPQADTRMTREFGAMVANRGSYTEGMATRADPGFSAKATELGSFGVAPPSPLFCDQSDAHERSGLCVRLSWHDPAPLVAQAPRTWRRSSPGCATRSAIPPPVSTKPAAAFSDGRGGSRPPGCS